MTDNSGSGEIFRARLASARDARKISQGDLAKKTGLPASSISHFEGGGRKPSFDNLLRLADALDVTTDYLLGRSGDVGTTVAAQNLHKHLDGLNSYDLDIAEKFIEVLASKSTKPPG